MSHRRAAAGLVLVASALSGCGASGTTLADDPATHAPTSASSSPAAPTTSASAAESATGSATGSATEPVAAGTLITLDTPADGASVSGSLQVSGTANSNEANVPWRILDARGTKVLDGFFTADGWMDKLYPYRGSVDVSSLAPGTYTFVVQVDDTSDGESGTPPQKVSRTITVS